MMCAFFYVFMKIMGNVKSQDNSMGGKNFEIKKAVDVSERLDDVKGIDEIRDEIKNLIKMIKNPDEYKSKGAKLHKGVLLYG